MGDKPSVAVLPFDDLSADQNLGYLGDGVAEDIITALSCFRSFLVIARNSTFMYKGRSVDVKQIGRELGVRYVLEGSVRKSGGRVRVVWRFKVLVAAGGHALARDRAQAWHLQRQRVGQRLHPQRDHRLNGTQTRDGVDEGPPLDGQHGEPVDGGVRLHRVGQGQAALFER